MSTSFVQQGHFVNLRLKTSCNTYESYSAFSGELQQNLPLRDILLILLHNFSLDSAGCDDVIGQAADAHWSEPVILSGIASSSGLAGHGPAARPSQPETVTNADVSRHVIGGHCWEGPVMEAHGCVCVCGQREPESLDPCWSGSPYVYYGGDCSLSTLLIVEGFFN